MEIKKYRIRDLSDIFYDAFGFFRVKFWSFGGILLKIILPIQLLFLTLYFTFYNQYGSYMLTNGQKMSEALSVGGSFNWIGVTTNVLLFSLNIATIVYAIKQLGTLKRQGFIKRWFNNIWIVWLKMIPVTMLIYMCVSYFSAEILMLLFFVIPFMVLTYPAMAENNFFVGLQKGISFGGKNWGLTLLVALLMGALCVIFYLFAIQPLDWMLDELILWHTVNVVDNDMLIGNIIQTFIRTGYLHMLIPIFFGAFAFHYHSIIDKEQAITLNNRFKAFGKGSKIYESSGNV